MCIVAEHIFRHPWAPEVGKTGERVPQVKGFEGSSPETRKIVVFSKHSNFAPRGIFSKKSPKYEEKPKFGVGSF